MTMLAAIDNELFAARLPFHAAAVMRFTFFVLRNIYERLSVKFYCRAGDARIKQLSSTSPQIN